MINSKPVKMNRRSKAKEDKDKAITPFQKLKATIVYAFKEHIYWPIDNFVSRYVERISRSIAYARFGWDNFDWDHAYAWDLMSFKLKRLQKCLQNGHVHQEKADMDALKEMIKIIGRLKESEYDDIYHKIHDKKWGRSIRKTTPIYDENGKIKHYRWESSKPKAKTEAQKTKERAGFLKCFELGEVDRLKDFDRMNEIMKKHMHKWWD